VPWEPDILRHGWTSVEKDFRYYSDLGCGQWPLLFRGGNTTNRAAQYRTQCGFANRLGCPFQLRVWVTFELATALQNYLRVNPHVDPADQSFDRNIYNKQTMRHGKKDERLLLHANHTNEEHTTYCLHLVSKHCEYVFRMYEANKWNI
jgi:hypothetical protein